MAKEIHKFVPSEDERLALRLMYFIVDSERVSRKEATDRTAMALSTIFEDGARAIGVADDMSPAFIKGEEDEEMETLLRKYL